MAELFEAPGIPVHAQSYSDHNRVHARDEDDGGDDEPVASGSGEPSAKKARGRPPKSAFSCQSSPPRITDSLFTDNHNDVLDPTLDPTLANA